MLRLLVLLSALLSTFGCGDGSQPNLSDARKGADGAATDGARPDAEPGALTSLLDDPPYLIGDPAGSDISDVVSGGAAPYACTFAGGSGRGSIPTGVSQDFAADSSGCSLIGGVDALSDAPGTYGFLVIVEDSEQAEVTIPVVYAGAACDTTAVTLAPASWPPIVNPTGAAQSWQLEVVDLDGVQDGALCDSCMSMSLSTRNPLSIAAGLECANAGDFCSDCDDCITLVGSCPGSGVATASRSLDLGSHGPLRETGPGWATAELGVTYSGNSLNPCGGKRWICHIELLELP